MLSVTSAQLSAWLAAFLWPLMRILGVITAAPLLGNQKLPARARIGLAVLLTLLIAPTLPAPPAVEPGSMPGLAILVQQLVIGVATGFAMRLVFTAVEMAGELVGLQMGFGFAQFYDPQSAAHVPVLGQFLGLVAALAFLAINGHLLLISAIAESFRVMPIAAEPFPPGLGKLAAEWGGKILYAAVLLSLPMIAALLITNLALGILTRAAPQLNMFVVGFPVTLAVGMGVLAWSLPYFLPLFERFAQDGIGLALKLGP